MAYAKKRTAQAYNMPGLHNQGHRPYHKNCCNAACASPHVANWPELILRPFLFIKYTNTKVILCNNMPLYNTFVSLCGIYNTLKRLVH
jgi:hypothetical protein